MRKLLIPLLLVSAAGGSFAQSPDVVIKVDAGLHHRSPHAGETTLRWYDSLGKHSTVGIQLLLEPGFRAYFSERLQRIENDGDNEQLDEYYVEDPGSWRLGKQYLPFGRNLILRESARAARGDTNLLLPGFSISGAMFDNGTNRNQGVIGRIGGTVGASAAVGRHIGIQGTSFNAVQRPEDAAGAGCGYRLALGLDAARRFGRYLIEGEFVVLREGHTAADADREISDLVFNFSTNKRKKIAIAWSRDWRQNQDFLRATAEIAISQQVWIEPILRLNRDGWYDVGVSVRAKL